MRKWTSIFSACMFALAAPIAIAQEQEKVILEADDISEEEDSNIIVATGSVEATYGGRVLRADRLVYDRRTGKVRASGNVVILDDEGTQQFADEVEVNERLDDGFAVGFSTRLPAGGVATANSAVRQPNGINALDQAVYTACEVCEAEGKRPTWALRARRAILNENNDIISYRDAVLEIAGLPVFYLPYFFHPDPSAGRRSGFLVPNIGVSSRLGATYEQPYYKVLSNSSDITITPRFYSRVRPLLEAEYRKQFWSGYLNATGSITYESDFDGNGNRFGEEEVRGHIFADGEFEINDTWEWGFGAERASDDLFTRRYSIEGSEVSRGLFDGQPRTLLSQLYAVGQTDNFYADASLLFFQDLQASNPNTAEPPIATPLVYADRLFDLGKYGRSSITASAAVLSRDRADGITPDINPDSRRVSIGADWSLTRVLPGGFVAEPFAEVRGDFYDLDAQASGQGSVSRAVGSVGAKLSWPLLKQGKYADILIEPTILGAWGLSDTNDPAIPIEDSELFEFDETRLFESNGFSNFDLYEGDGKLSVGVTTSARFKNGWSIDAIAGRRWRSEVDEAFNVATNLDGKSSDWVGSVSTDFGRRLRLETRVRLDGDDFTLNRIDAKASTRFWRLSASARYFRIDEDIRPDITVPDEGIDISARFRLHKNFSLSYRQLRDFTDERDLNRSVGIAYTDDCSRFEIIYQRNESIDRTIGQTDTVLFRFSLLTLGEFGSS
ncbi:MAG: LPS assembly protein LptD [Hyphomonadaceae bacterium]